MQQSSQQNNPALGPWTAGFVNAVDARQVPLSGLVDARDCNIDRAGRAVSRKKYDLIDSNGYNDPILHNGVLYATSSGIPGVVGSTGFTPIASGLFGGWAPHASGLAFAAGGAVYGAPESVDVTLADPFDTFSYAPMPTGSALAIWNGRTLAARNRTLYWSEPLSYDVCRKETNYVRVASNITWMAALDTGVYLGTQDSVIFLQGIDPAEFTLRQVSGISCPKSGIVTTTEHMPAELTRGAKQVAVWFSDVGFVVGLPDGTVVYPQADKIIGLPIVTRNLVVDGDRIYAFS